MEAFQLRLWDGRIGRWLSVDPYGQYASPYLGMGNNPIGLTDPDGGRTNWHKDAEGNLVADKGDNAQTLAAFLKTDVTFALQLLKDQGVKINNGILDLKVGQEIAPVVVKGYGKKKAESLVGNWLNSPVGNASISSLFMASRDCKECSNTHGGTDYAVAVGTKVSATANGYAERVYKSSSFGNAVIINHGKANDGNTVYTLYGHGSKHNIAQGQIVTAGQIILLSGNTGHSTGPHLHYEVIKTKYSPNNSNFFGNLKIRYAPNELGNLLKK